ncbi:MAG: hypothetical protein E7Z95_05655 [Actinomyces succiniciruminis]|uniref:Uncharacterized protein n=1 Tax=Actinomyces succiniciruminis TaxID=1522002 RepID=A0A1L7RD71_9ACTO|nr:hypothetical protein [Actinomyces succiniciruminis]MBE6475040.1 hypothetical protein [Actinomyces succiniciruminis]CED91881.1 Hypothetical protein AAM4_2049 [Actinomyces succiniciruminis]
MPPTSNTGRNTKAADGHVDVPPTTVIPPDGDGKFSLSEDWVATITGLGLLVLALLGVIPSISGWL